MSHQQKELPGRGAQFAQQTHEGAAIVPPAGAANLDTFEWDRTAAKDLRLVQLLPHRHVSTRTIRRQIERDYIKEQKRLAKKGGA